MIVTNPFDVKAWTRAQVDQVSRGWWVLLITGVISAVAGGIIIFNDWTVGDLAVFIGFLLIFRGIFTTFSIPIDGSARTWSVVLGLIEIGVGVAVFAWPGQTLLVVAAFIGWFLLFGGIMAIVGSLSGRRVLPYWGVILALGIIEVGVAFYLLDRPGLTLVAAVLAIGLSALLYGVVEIVLAFEIKHMPERFEEFTSDVNGARPQRRVETAAR